MYRRLSMLLFVGAASLAAACSSSGGPSVAPPTSTVPSSIAISIGNVTNFGAVETFQLNVVVTNAKGQTVTGQYSQPVTLTTSDTNDTGFAPDYAASSVSSSVTITNSTQSVFLVYDGASVGTIDLTATTSSANTTVAFEATGLATTSPTVGTSPSPTTSASASPTPTPTASPYISLLYVSTAGAPPFPPNATATGPGSQPIYISARDENGNVIDGTYPSTVSVTINNADQLDLSLTQYVAAADCGTDTTCTNNAAVAVTQSGAVVFGNYTSGFQSSQVSVSTISTDTAGNRVLIECSAINFPLQNGSTPYTCQPVNPAPSSVHRSANGVKTNMSREQYFSKK